VKTNRWGVWMVKAQLILKDIFFPIFCVICQAEGTILCSTCKNAQDNTGAFFDMPIVHAAISLHAPGKVLTALLYAYKYEGSDEAAMEIGRTVFLFGYTNKEWFAGADTVTYVPLHPRRLAERGYNQAEYIAKRLSEAIDVPCERILARRRYTKQQARLDESGREENVTGAFGVIGEVAGKRIVLVDDVYTTGATVVSCIEELYSKGAAHVKVFTLLYRE